MNRPLPLDTAPPEPALFSEREFRDALGRFATGVAVVTALARDGSKVGLTISSFSAVSLAPPLVLWSLMKTASLMPVFRNTPHYAINVLGAQQQALAVQFSRHGIDRWAGVDWSAGKSGMPLLADTVASFECRSNACHEAGDHDIFVGQVLYCSSRSGARPLLYHGGRFYSEHPLMC